MKLRKIILPLVVLLVSCQGTETKTGELAEIPERPKTPIMGWSSWNNFHVNISEEIIRTQADHMVSTGMRAAGYSYINIDDGFFGGRDENGNLIAHMERFPGGMKAVSEYIHSRGLKAGIYSEAGINTCASFWDADTIGVGMGLFGYDEQDLTLMLDEWGYDFIKVDWCGADAMGLDEQTRYTEIGSLIRSIRPDVVYNICRWEFPGEWAVQVADSWRISGDISNRYESILRIIDLNADLWRYASPGHVNDMDMLQVGRGMSYEEDKAHFSMWCMMCSPLLAGNDLSNMSEETLGILINEELIAINQDPLVYQARRIIDHGELEVWAKPLGTTINGQVAVALLNRSENADTIGFDMSAVGIVAARGYTLRDLWEKKDYDLSTKEFIGFKVPAHGVVILRVNGTSSPFNIFQRE